MKRIILMANPLFDSFDLTKHGNLLCNISKAAESKLVKLLSYTVVPPLWRKWVLSALQCMYHNVIQRFAGSLLIFKRLYVGASKGHCS